MLYSSLHCFALPTLFHHPRILHVLHALFAALLVSSGLRSDDVSLEQTCSKCTCQSGVRNHHNVRRARYSAQLHIFIGLSRPVKIDLRRALARAMDFLPFVHYLFFIVSEAISTSPRIIRDLSPPDNTLIILHRIRVCIIRLCFLVVVDKH